MRTVMLVGPVGCGKSTFCRAAQGMSALEKKTQAVEILGSAIDTPGEYLENPRLYRALAVTAAQADVILLMLSCSGDRNHFPPGFASMFGGKPVYGIISKTDLAPSARAVEETGAYLLQAGAVEIFPVSSVSKGGLDAVGKVIYSIEEVADGKL